MRRSLVITAVLATFATPLEASEGVDLSFKSKSMAASSAAAATPGKDVEAPFRTVRDPIPDLLASDQLTWRGPRGACENSARSLCYDHVDRRVVYRPARKYMPQFDGLRAESISVRQDRIILKYSFR